MKESAYDFVAKFYDTVTGNSKDSSDYVLSKIKRYNNKAASILELGCGTGNILKELHKDFDVTGVDISKGMLKIAKKKIPKGKFYLQDIRNFRIDKKFDVILCLYDTINHLTLFNDWKKIFTNVYEHLNNNGLFIFDINTLYKLDGMSFISPVVNKFNSNYLLIDVNRISGNLFNWNLKIFESKNKSNFKLHETNIKEASFNIEKIVRELSKLFMLKRVEEESLKKVRQNSERVFFICQKNY